MTRTAKSVVRNGRQETPPDLLQQIGELVSGRGPQVGDQLPSIRDLAAEFGTKASAVREALLRAQAMNLVRMLPRAAAFLQATDFTRASRANGASRQETPPTLHIATNVFHLLEARALIEV